MSIWRWADWITRVPASARISLGEGNTPLHQSRGIARRESLPNLFLKLENLNPSGSYKDRFAAAAVSRMVADNQNVCLATSSGNAGAALAAYCAASGVRCRIAIVESAPQGKTKQMLAYGAELFRVKGFGTDAEITSSTFRLLEEFGRRPGYALQISAYHYCPEAMTGCETIALETAEQADQIDHVFCPSGGGGLCLAIARGFQAMAAAGRLSKMPAVHCVQPEGNDTIAGSLKSGRERACAVRCTTKVSGLQVATVIDGDEVIRACRDSGGTGHLVSDDEVYAVQKRLAREEGVFTEPAGAVALAGVLKAVREGLVRRDASIVCLVTGSGFKDEASLDRMIADGDCPTIDPDELADKLLAS
ncbi:MAG: pyridoxal-phosphate dependent enzyme [Planctomycetaceae bacterium]